MDTRKIFADNLSRLLEERGLEQQRVASDLNISTSTLSAWVTGQRFPRPAPHRPASNPCKICPELHRGISRDTENRPLRGGLNV